MARKALEPAATPPEQIRNFCIIAHIDHGKSTLADRMLSKTGVVEDRAMRAQYLDRMDIERERGITIKSQAVRMPWELDGTTYCLNMIDTPGHVDFTYEVSRSLAACEGAVLLVDAAQGIEAQTLANLYLAMENDLTIIPVLNKIDLPAAQPEKYAAEIAGLIGCEPEDVLKVSGKTGVGVEDLLDRVVRAIPGPEGDADAPARAMIFDSVYDTYRGVVTYVRVVDGKLTHRDRIKMMSTGVVHEMLEVGVISPEPVKAGDLGVGEVGYLITGVKDVRQSRVGDTVTSVARPATTDLGGYRHPNPMVFAGLFPIDAGDYGELRSLMRERTADVLVLDINLPGRSGLDVLHALIERVGNLGVHTIEDLREFTRRVSPQRRAKRTWAQDLPEQPGVYLFVSERDDAREVLYVGTSRNIRRRVRTYFTAAEKRPRMEEMVRVATGVEAVPCATPLQAEVGQEILNKLTAGGKKNKAPATDAGTSQAPPVKHFRTEPFAGKVAGVRRYKGKQMPTSSG